MKPEQIIEMEGDAGASFVAHALCGADTILPAGTPPAAPVDSAAVATASAGPNTGVDDVARALLRVVSPPAAVAPPERYESLESALAALDDPSLQPALPYENMIYLASAQPFGYAVARDIPIFHDPAQRPWEAVRFQLTYDGALEAALAALAAVRPQALRSRLRTDSGSHLLAQLYAPSRLTPSRPTPVTFQIDAQVPVHETGGLMGTSGETRADSLWPLLLAKAMLKLDNVTRLFDPTPPSFGDYMLMLTGSRTQTLRQASHLPLRLPEAFYSGMACSVSFGAVSGVLSSGNAIAQDGLGGLAVLVKGHGGPDKGDVLLLVHHHYAVVGFDRPERPRWVCLYNPLGYNVQPAPGSTGLGNRKFFDPHALQSLPKVCASFWVPLHLLQDLPCRLHMCAV